MKYTAALKLCLAVAKEIADKLESAEN